MISDECFDRVVNWKFMSAEEHLTDEATAEERIVIETLARMFGNSGWFWGDMGTVVRRAIQSLNLTEEGRFQ